MGASAFGTFAMIAAIALLLLGVALIKISFWPRRKGDEPHCRFCGYPLIGIENGTCPECGRSWNQSNIVRGTRHRRWGLGVFAVAVFLLPLFLETMQWLNSFDVYHLYPENWLLNQIDSGSDGAAQR